MLKLSIIVPVYNTSAYLHKCVTSLIRQTEPDIEIILVDDGSEDSSLSICKEFAIQDNRIKVISKSNGGVSSARNLGLEAAGGVYVTFVDSDDYVDECMYENLLAKVFDDIDIVISGIIAEYKSKSVPHSVPDYIKDSYADESIKQEFIPFFLYYGKNIAKRPLMGSACRMLFRRSLLQNSQIRFSEKIKFCEDLLFCINALSVSKKVHIDRNCHYHYLRNMGTSTEKYMPDLLNDFLYVLDNINVDSLLSIHADRFRNCPSIKFAFLIESIRNLSRKSASVFATGNELVQILKMEVFCDVCNNIAFKNLPKAQKILFYPIKFKFAIVIVLLFKIR